MRRKMLRLSAHLVLAGSMTAGTLAVTAQPAAAICGDCPIGMVDLRGNWVTKTPNEIHQEEIRRENPNFRSFQDALGWLSIIGSGPLPGWRGGVGVVPEIGPGRIGTIEPGRGAPETGGGAGTRAPEAGGGAERPASEAGGGAEAGAPGSGGEGGAGGTEPPGEVNPADETETLPSDADAAAEGPIPNVEPTAQRGGPTEGVARFFVARFGEPARTLVEGKNPLGPENAAIKKLLAPGGRIGQQPDGVADFTRLAQELTDSLASPDRDAADAVARFDALMYRFSSETPQAPLGRTTYLPKANLDNVREIVSAKRLYENGERGFGAGTHESQTQGQQTPDYVFDDESIGDHVRISAKDEAGFVKALKDAVSKKISTYSNYRMTENPNAVAPLNVIVDASDTLAVREMSQARLDELTAQAVQPFINGKLARVLVIGKGPMTSHVILSNNRATPYRP